MSDVCTQSEFIRTFRFLLGSTDLLLTSSPSREINLNLSSLLKIPYEHDRHEHVAESVLITCKAIQIGTDSIIKSHLIPRIYLLIQYGFHINIQTHEKDRLQTEINTPI